MMKDQPYQSKEQTERARLLRQAMIDAEEKLWFHFRAENTKDLKIRRQHPVGPYILDFYCHKARLALEIDGSSHEFKVEHDERRDAYMRSRGIETLRFKPGVSDDGIIEFVAWFREQCRDRACEPGEVSL